MATALRYLAARQSGGSPIAFVLSSAARRPFSIAHRRPFSIAPRRLRPLVAVADPTKAVTLDPRRRIEGLRCFSSSNTSSSLSDPSPNWSNRPPKETILLDGCDFEHWLVVVEPPDPNLTRDEIIDSYITTLAKVVGSKEDARFKIYSVSTKHYFAFGALVSEELSYKLKELPGVRWVLPDSYLDVRNKDYGGEPFIDGQAVPYDPKYHEEWVRNNARAMERNRRSDRPRSFDRSRNFERRSENMQNFRNQTSASPPMQQRMPPSPPPPPQNLGNQPPATPPMQQQQPPPPPHPLPRNLGNQSNPGPMASSPPNMGGPNQMPGSPPNLGGPSYMSNPNPIPPPMPGGAPPYDAPNYGFQSQPPNYQNSSSSHPNQGFGIQGHGGGNSYANSMPHSSSTNPYQGPPPNYFQNSPPTYQQPPQNAYQPNPGAYQGGPSQGYRGNVDGNNPYQGRGGHGSSNGNGGDTYQGQDFGRQN